MHKNRMTLLILAAMVLGSLLGGVAHAFFPDLATQQIIAGDLSIGSTVFLRLIKMILAPLIFSTLVVGIGHMSDAAAVGRIGGKAMLWFVCASLLSLTLGLVLVNIFQPGVGMHKVNMMTDTHLSVHSLTLDGFIQHMVPDSIFRAMADNEVLQIVVFSIFFGIACASLPAKAKVVLEWAESLSHIILRVTSYVMMIAPLAVFCAMAATVTTNGFSILSIYGKFMGEFYLALATLWAALIGIAFTFLGKQATKLISLMREPFLLAFSTASSEAAYPLILEQLTKLPVSRKVSSFVLPLGYSFNLDGTMMYCTFASIFIAQAYDIALPWSTQITMLLVLMLTSKGMAGIPRASSVVIVATLGQFNIPEEGILLILGIDTFLDMGRSATNVIGNSLAAAVIDKWETQRRPPLSP